MSVEAFEATAAIRKPSRWGLAVFGLPIANGLGILVYTLVAGLAGETLQTVPLLAIAAAMLWVGSAFAVRTLYGKPLFPGATVTEPVQVRADATGLCVGHRVVLRPQIKQALLVPVVVKDGISTMVRVTRRWLPPIDIVVKDADEARELLAAIGMGASQAVARFSTLSRVFVNKWRLAAAAFAIMASIPVAVLLAPLLAVVPLLMFFLMPLLMLPTRVEVGSDGLLVRWMGTKRFIPTSAIAKVRNYDGEYYGAKVWLRSGEEVKLPMGNRTVDSEAAASLVARLTDTVEGYQRGGAETAAALLAQGDRPTTEWIQTLRALGAGAVATLRTATLDSERLWRVLESPHAQPRDRAAAAVALSAGDEPGNRERIRVAAAAIAQPKLRVAIEAASREDETALLEALLEMENRR